MTRWFLLAVLLLAACAPAPPAGVSTPSPTTTPTAVATATPQASPSPEGPPVSLVFWLSKPRVYRPADLQAAVKRAFQKSAKLTETTPETTWVEFDGWALLYNHVGRPYFDRPLPELPKHRAWISVDILGQPQGASRLEVYQQLGRLLAELGGPDVVTVFHPESGKGVPYSSDAPRLLRLNPLVNFGFEKEPPVTNVQTEDVEMRAAEPEATRRFPEFRARFERHPAGERFYIKAPFHAQGGELEFMWVLVQSLADQKVRGRLANDPEGVPGLKAGDPVEIPLAQVEDWNILDARGEMVAGGFTTKVLMKRQGTSTPER